MTELEESQALDRYWLGRARRMMDAAITSREEAASKLIVGVGWFWIVYTGAVLGVIAVARVRPNLATTIVLVVPVVILVFAYLAALWAIVPISAEFDPSRADLVEKAYADAVGKKRFRLALAFFLAASGAISVVAAAVAATESQAAPSTLEAVLVSDGRRNDVAVEGVVHPSKLVVITLHRALGEKVVSQTSMRSDADGVFRTILTTEEMPRRMIVSARWSAESRFYSVSREVSRGTDP